MLANQLAGIADGCSISALLPLLNTTTRGKSDSAEIPPGSAMRRRGLEVFIIGGLSTAGLEPTLCILLSVLVSAVIYAGISMAMSWKDAITVFGIAQFILIISNQLVSISMHTGTKTQRLILEEPTTALGKNTRY